MQIISSANLPVTPPTDMSTDTFLELMSRDKKVRVGRIRLVLLKTIGDAVVSTDYDDQLLNSTIEHCLSNQKAAT